MFMKWPQGTTTYRDLPRSLKEGLGRLIAETDITHVELGFNDTSASGRAACMDIAKRRNKEASTSPSRPKVRVTFI